MPLSTTLACWKNCIHGATVVPIAAITMRMKPWVGMIVGTTVAT